MFCLGKTPGAIPEFVLRGHLEITVKIGLVGWTYRKELTERFGRSRAYCSKKFADRNTVQYGRLMTRENDS